MTERDFVQMRWGLVPWWWSKPLKELRAATFNARAETVETKPFFRDAFNHRRPHVFDERRSDEPTNPAQRYYPAPAAAKGAAA